MDILHRIGVEHASPEQVYDALTTLDGLAGWWTEKTTGTTDVGGVIEFHFGPGDIDMEVAQLDPGRSIRWKVVAGPDEWIGTHVQWDLRREGDYTIVLFKHEGWREPVEFMHHCSTKWATFLVSLKQLVETGTGAPDPRDLRISDWH
jgi:uncharacterized protein YndB with AHSA1/START domain